MTVVRKAIHLIVALSFLIVFTDIFCAVAGAILGQDAPIFISKATVFLFGLKYSFQLLLLASITYLISLRWTHVDSDRFDYSENPKNGK